METKKIIALFFENIGIRQTVSKNVFWLVGTQVIVSSMSMVLLVLAVRFLGAAEYGKFAYAMAFVSIAACIVDFGVASITVRELAKEQANEKDFNLFLSFKIMLCTVFFVVTFIGSFFITRDPFIRQSVWILSAFVCTESIFQMMYAFFHAKQKMQFESIIHLAQTLAIIAAGVMAVFLFPTTRSLSYGYFIGSSAVLTFVIIYVHFFVIKLKWAFDKKIWMDILKWSWPLVFNFVASWMYLHVDAFMIGFMGSSKEVGMFSVASRIIAVMVILSGLVSRGFYPALSKFLGESKEKFQLVWDYNMKTMIALALPIMAGGIIFASKIIHLFYGTGFEPSVAVFQILIVFIGLTFLSYPYSMVLAVCNRQRTNFVIISSGFIINIIFNLMFFPLYGIYGVAFASVLTTAILWVLLMVFFKKLAPVPPLDWQLCKVFLGSGLSCLITFYLLTRPVVYHLPILLLIPAGGLLYVVVFYAIDRASRKLLKQNIF